MPCQEFNQILVDLQLNLSPTSYNSVFKEFSHEHYQELLTMSSASLLRSSLVWDNHGCMPLRPLDETFLPQLELYRTSGVDVAMINIGFGDHGIEQ